MTNTDDMVARICGELRNRQRFVISSHARPDGDSIGSQMALACALRDMGKQVRVVNHDAAAPNLAGFPGVSSIEIADSVEGDYDAAVIMECGDLSRTGVAGLERYFIINIDHHQGNTMYGAINWFDESAAACGEMVFDVIKGLGTGLTRDIATHIYLAILTDTGSFHYSSISPRTFDICRQAMQAGIDPVTTARTVYDDSNVGRLKLTGVVLGSMQVDAGGRMALLYMDRKMASEAGGSYDDTEGLINQPLNVKEIQAVVFFKESDNGEFRVSLRSKGEIDVSAVAKRYGGGGHRNAAGCTVPGPYDERRDEIARLTLEAIQAGTSANPA